MSNANGGFVSVLLDTLVHVILYSCYRTIGPVDMSTGIVDNRTQHRKSSRSLNMLKQTKLATRQLFAAR